MYNLRAALLGGSFYFFWKSFLSNASRSKHLKFKLILTKPVSPYFTDIPEVSPDLEIKSRKIFFIFLLANEKIDLHLPHHNKQYNPPKNETACWY